MRLLYLPGTNKKVGYMLRNAMHIYDRYIKYFPVPIGSTDCNGYGYKFGSKFIIQEDDKYLELQRSTGWYHETNEKMYTFFDCEFKDPDNLDLVEISYLYKNWNKK